MLENPTLLGELSSFKHTFYPYFWLSLAGFLDAESENLILHIARHSQCIHSEFQEKVDTVTPVLVVLFP